MRDSSDSKRARTPQAKQARAGRPETTNAVALVTSGYTIICFQGLCEECFKLKGTNVKSNQILTYIKEIVGEFGKFPLEMIF